MLGANVPESHPEGNNQDTPDGLQGFFRRPLFLSLTIGIPFCIFKILFGTVAIRIGTASLPPIAVAGLVIFAWAWLDLLMNTGNALYDLFSRKSPFEYCSIAQIGRAFGKPAIFLALDTLITFSIICGMLWTRWITKLTMTETNLWIAATTLNLISLSLVLLYNEIRRA
jgi:hypothetical protein